VQAHAPVIEFEIAVEIAGAAARDGAVEMVFQRHDRSPDPEADFSA
jgi:hypothetical protein